MTLAFPKIIILPIIDLLRTKTNVGTGLDSRPCLVSIIFAVGKAAPCRCSHWPEVNMQSQHDQEIMRKSPDPFARLAVRLRHIRHVLITLLSRELDSIS